MSRPVSRLVFFLLILGLILAAPAAVIAYRVSTSRPTYLMNKGTEALGREDMAEAQQFAERLQRRGYDSAAHILRGKIFLHLAKKQLDTAPPPFPYEGMQKASHMVLSAGGLSVYPPMLRGPEWLALVQIQKRFRREISGVEELLDALGEFTEVLDGDPWAAEATVLASECLVRLGDRQSAEMALSSLVERQPDNLDAHRWLAAIYVDVNATTLAVPHLREWIRLDAKDPRPYRWLCLITRDTEEGYSEAIQLYRKMLQLDLDGGERAGVLKELAETQIAAQADYPRALETLAEGPQAFQDRPSIRLLRAECLLGLGKVDEARRIVDGVLRENPNLTNAMLFRAKIYLQDDQPNFAIPLLEKLVSLHPNNSKARQALILAYRSMKDDRRAAEQKRFLDTMLASRGRFLELQSLAANDPWNGRARLEMAVLNSSINYSEALAWIRFALASRPDDPRIRKVWTELVGYQPPPLLRDFQVRRQRKADSK
jgi:tetratricopeptide (TPR) repeat protein